jgi:hypothetical protein
MREFKIKVGVICEQKTLPPGLRAFREGLKSQGIDPGPESLCGQIEHQTIEFKTLAPNMQWARDIATGISDANQHSNWEVTECDGMSHCHGPEPVLNMSGARMPPNCNL